MNKHQKDIIKIAKRIISITEIASWKEAKACAKMHLNNDGKVSDIKNK